MFEDDSDEMPGLVSALFEDEEVCDDEKDDDSDDESDDLDEDEEDKMPGLLSDSESGSVRCKMHIILLSRGAMLLIMNMPTFCLNQLGKLRVEMYY